MSHAADARAARRTTRYSDKTKLFMAVLVAVEDDVMRRLFEAVLAAQPATSADALRIGADAWPEVRTVVHNMITSVPNPPGAPEP